MKPGVTRKNDPDSSPGPSLDGSFRKSESARSTSSNISTKFVPTSNRVYKVLKEYSSKLIDPTILADHLYDWVTKNPHTKNEHHFASPFSIDELRTFRLRLRRRLVSAAPPHAFPALHLRKSQRGRISRARGLSTHCG